MKEFKTNREVDPLFEEIKIDEETREATPADNQEQQDPRVNPSGQNPGKEDLYDFDW